MTRQNGRHVKVEETYCDRRDMSSGGPNKVEPVWQSPRPCVVERSEDEKKKKQNPGERETIYRFSLSKKPY